MRFTGFLLICLASLLAGCFTQDQDAPRQAAPPAHPAAKPAPAAGSLAFYFARGDFNNLQKMTLEPKPFLTDKDILAYEWTSHTLTLTHPAFERFPGGDSIDKIIGWPFVLVVNGQRCYAGSIMTPACSTSLDYPAMLSGRYSTRLDQKTIFRAFPVDSLPPDGPDPRFDERVKAVLKAQGKLRGENLPRPAPPRAAPAPDDENSGEPPAVSRPVRSWEKRH